MTRPTTKKTSTKPLAILAVAGLLVGCMAEVTDETDGGDDVGLEDGEEVGQVGGALTVQSWSDDVKVPSQSSKYAPALVSYGNKLHMVHNGTTRPTHLWRSTFNGSSWTPNTRIYGHYATGAPALAVYKNQMHMAYQKAGTNDLYMAVSYDGGSSWSGAKKAVNTRSAPALTVFNGKLYMSHCSAPAVLHSNYFSMKEYIAVEVWDGYRWRREQNVHTGSNSFECKGTALAAVGSQLRLVFNVKQSFWPLRSDRYYMGEAVWTPGEAAQSKELRNKFSKNPPSMTVCNGYAHLVHSGESSNKIYWSSQYNWWPSGWTDDVAVPNQTSRSGAGLGCYNGRAIMVHNGNYSDQLYWSSFYQAPFFSWNVVSTGTVSQ